jgi:hypothetical protein
MYPTMMALPTTLSPALQEKKKEQKKEEKNTVARSLLT